MKRRSCNPDNPVALERTTVQTLLFPKDAFTVATARAWAKQHNFQAPKVDSGSARATRLRVRQREPSAFQKGSFRTILLDHARGVEAVIGKPVRRNPPEIVFSKDSTYEGRKTFDARVEGSSWNAPRVAIVQTWGVSKHGATKGQRIGPTDDWTAYDGDVLSALARRAPVIGRGTRKEMKALARNFLLGEK